MEINKRKKGRKIERKKERNKLNRIEPMVLITMIGKEICLSQKCDQRK